jgi:hypothetical protein
MEGREKSVEKYEPPTLRIIDSVAELTQAQREKRLGAPLLLPPAPRATTTRRTHKSPANARLWRPVIDHH